MNNQEIVKKAVEYTLKKFPENGYAIIHSQEVAYILSSLLPDDANLIAAGYLHDLIEDGNVTHKGLRKEFGKDIADLVNEVTKEGYNNFPRLKTRRGVMLKFADRLSNLRGMGEWSKEKQAEYIKKSKFWI